MFNTIYLSILLLFLILISYYISKEISQIIKDIQLENLLRNKSELNNITDKLHFKIAKLYFNKNIIDAAIYELIFNINKTNKSTNTISENLSINYNLLGKSYEKLNKYQIARNQYYKALQLCPQNEITIQYLIDNLILSNKTLEAIEIGKQFLELSPNNSRITTQIESLEKKL
uniref:Tetratricopeptide repeat protein 21A/21B C-terminal ARM domain-containing protein n=1 Tax=Rhodochaete parvula TaxID=110510 RepID=A0A220T0D3_9RHOD|nr:hypothetical protein Rhodc_022 [Rhodochaete parvula]